MTYVGKKPADIIATAVDTTTGTFSGDLTVDTNTLYVDSANNNVGIGNSSPADKLDVNGKSTFRDNIRLPSTNYIYSYAGGTATTVRSGFYLDGTNNNLNFLTNDTERMRIDSSGNVGIGNSIPSSFNAGANNLVVGTGSGSEGITIYGGAESNIFFADGTSGSATTVGRIEYSHGLEKMFFYVNNLNAMNIESSGIVNINTTVQLLDNNEKVRIVGKTSVTNSSDWTLLVNRDGSDGNLIAMMRGAAVVGSISVTGSSTSYNTSSDHRLKENVTADWDATTRLKQLNPVRFNFIADADRTVDGFLAHEVQSVVPEAITGTHNEVDADGNPVYQGIDQSKLVPLLVKTIQELEARIVALENA